MDPSRILWIFLDVLERHGHIRERGSLEALSKELTSRLEQPVGAKSSNFESCS